MIGRRISHYEILEKIGQGGMGEVYLAQDTSLDRRVALKFLPEDAELDVTEKKRFLRGAKSAAALDHPYICNIYGVGEFEGRSFIAMEHVRGETLERWLTKERLPLGQALRIACEIAEALETAHSGHIVHRDLKPSNIMLTVGDHVKILDFGLAKRVAPLGDRDSQYETASQLTGRGSTVGTLAHMSPEQLRGQAVDSRSDIFSFGVVLYEMLAGVHPFHRSTPIETAAAVLNVEPQPLSRYRDDGPHLLGHVLRKMLAKDPGSRYQLVHEVRTDLTHVGDAVAEQSRTPVPAPTPRPSAPRAPTIPRPLTDRIPTERVIRWARSHRQKIVVSSAVAALLVLAAAVATWWSSRPSPPARDLSVAVLPFENTSADPLESLYISDGISRAVSRKLARAGVRVSPWDTVRRYQNSGKTADRIGRELNTDAVLSGTFDLDEDRIRINLSLADLGSSRPSWEDELQGSYEDLFALENRIVLGAAARLKTALGDVEEAALVTRESTSLDAYDFYMQGSHFLQEGSEGAFDVAFRYLNRALDIDGGLSLAHAGLGTIYMARYFDTWEGALENLDRAEESYQTALRLDPTLERARRGLIQVNWERGSSEACLIQGREAMPSAPSQDVETLLARADALHLGGLRELALPLYRKVIELDPMNQAAHWMLVAAATFAGELDEAIRIGDRYVRRFGGDNDIHRYLGIAYQLSGDPVRAREHYQKAIELVDAQSSEQPSISPSSVVESLFVAGLFYERQGESVRAEETWRKGVRLIRPKLLAYPGNGNLGIYLASLNGLLGEREALSDEPSESFPLASVALLYLATVYAKQGEIGAAAEMLQRTLAQGRVDSAWRTLFELASVSERVAELEGFRSEFEAEERRLKHRYGS